MAKASDITEELTLVTGETVFSQDDIDRLLSELEVGIHNMWVDARTKDFETGDYSRVDVTVEITVRERGDEF